MTDFPKKHPLLWAYLFAAYFSLSYHIPIYVTGMAGFIGLRETILMSLMWLIPILLAPRYTRLLLALSGLIMLPAAVISVFYFIIYGQEFSQSAIFIVFESNAAEGSEFVASYWQWWFIPVLILFAAVPIWIWRQARPVALGHRKRLAYAALFILIPFFPFISTALTEENTTLSDAVHHQMKRMEPAAPWNLIVGYAKYQQQMASMTALLEKIVRYNPSKT
jgi:heptose-I-phosphate ethanolaminephosphotransferase